MTSQPALSFRSATLSPKVIPDRRRRLPHVQPQGKVLFITFRLHGSLPAQLYPPPNKPMTDGEKFVLLDRYLDRARNGPLYLQRPEVARIVVDSLHFGADELHHYELQAWAMMPNHAHTLALPIAPVPRFLQSLKGFTAREAKCARRVSLVECEMEV